MAFVFTAGFTDAPSRMQDSRKYFFGYPSFDHHATSPVVKTGCSCEDKPVLPSQV